MLATSTGLAFGLTATEQAYALYAEKLAALHELGLLRPPILYPAGGVDYFPAAYGETVYLDYDPAIYPAGYLRFLRFRFSSERGLFPLPRDDSRIRTLREDLAVPESWAPHIRGTATLFLKGAAHVLGSAVSDPERAFPIVRTLADGVVAGGIGLLFDGDKVFSDLFSRLGWETIRFREPDASLLSHPSGGVVEFIGPDWEYIVGIKSGGAVQAFRKPLATEIRGME